MFIQRKKEGKSNRNIGEALKNMDAPMVVFFKNKRRKGTVIPHITGASETLNRIFGKTPHSC